MPQVRRKADNEAIFRAVNEEIEKLGVAHRQDRMEIVCECAVLGCAEPVRVFMGAYQEARRDPRNFIVAPGHTDPSIEIVIAETDDYMIVQKIGAAADEAVITWES
jgi:hypothetical protein